MLQEVLAEESKVCEACSTVKFEWHDARKDPDGKRAAHCVAQYVAQSKDMNPQPHMIGVMTDKAWMHGLPIQMTGFTYINNNFSISTPAVACGGGGKPAHPTTLSD